MSWGWNITCCCGPTAYYYSNTKLLTFCTGLVYCQTAADLADVANPWSNVGNIPGNPDGHVASVNGVSGTSGTVTFNSLAVTKFTGLSIPSGAINITAHMAVAGGCPGGVFNAVTTVAYFTTDGASRFGSGTTDAHTWPAGDSSFNIPQNASMSGGALAPSDINGNANFGIIFQCSQPKTNPILGGPQQLGIDAIAIQVCYQLPA